MQDATYYFNLVNDAVSIDSETATESSEILMHLAKIVMTQEERDIMQKDVSSFRISERNGLRRIVWAVLKRKDEIQRARAARGPIDRSSIQF